MTDDLVERLRAVAILTTYDVCRQAADRIEELEQQTKELAAVVEELVDEDAAARIEKLEAALREIEYLDSPLVRGKPRRVEIYDIARAALGEKKDGNV